MDGILKKSLIIISCFFAPWTMAQDGEELVDRIVAIVDGYPILHSEIMEKVDNGPLVVVSDFPDDEKAKPYRRALQDQINFELVMQVARDLEIEVRDSQVEDEVERFLESRGLSRQGLMTFLEQQGKSFDEYKADFRDQMVLRRFQGRVITPLVKITDKDVETFYLKKSGATADLVSLTLRQILIKIPEGTDEQIVEAKQNLAQEVHKKLIDGMEFVDAVKIYSDDKSARENGGLMKDITLKDLAGQIRVEVESLELKKFTIPVRTALGFHIFYLEDKKFSGSEEFLSQKKRLEFELRNLELANQTRKWLSEQRQRSKVIIID